MSKKDPSNKFNFFVPATFEKGNSSEGSYNDMVIKGVCSTTSQDSDGEVLMPEGFDFAPLLQKGFVNWNHQASKTSAAIIGEVSKGEVINNGKDFYIEGFLYPDSAEARSVYELAGILEKNSPTRRLGFSIEGQALEKDPINPKIIRKARITGLAITGSPKNPNTLLSIMKGEYAEPFVDDETEEEEDEENKKEKAMTAEAGDRVTSKESVEGGQKILDSLHSEKIEKSEVYSQIIDKYDTYDEEIIKGIYSLVEKVNDQQNMGLEINQEILNKSFEILEQADALKKSEGADKMPIDDVASMEAHDKREMAKAETEAKEKLEKALACAKENMEKGMDETSSVEDMIRKGFGLTESQTAVQTAISEYQAVGIGGEIQTLKSEEDELGKAKSEEVETLVATPIFKSEDLDLIKGMIVEQISAIQIPEAQTFDMSSVEELIKSEVSTIGATMGTQFTALGNLLKGQFEQNSLLTKQLELLEKSNTELTARFTEIDKAPVRRSVTSVAAIDRTFEKGNQENAFDANTYSLSKKEDRESLTERLFNEYAMIKGNNREDESLARAIQDIESSGQLLGEQVQRIKALGIKVTA